MARGSSQRGRHAGPLSSFFRAVPARFGRSRILISLAVFVLVLLGLTMIYSATSVVAAMQGTSPSAEVLRQSAFAAFGIVAAVVIASQDYHLWMRWTLVLAWLAVVILLALVIASPLGRTINNATRWIEISGVRLQPSEFAKVTIIMATAAICQGYLEDAHLSLPSFVLLLGVALGIPLLLIVLEPDNGTFIILLVVIIAMLYLGGISLGVPLAVMAALVTIIVALGFVTHSHVLARLLTFFQQNNDPGGASYQQNQAVIAIGSGGLFGTGIGGGMHKYAYIPEEQTDFILAMIGEELGLVGTLGVVVCYGVIVWEGMHVARYAPDLSGRLLAAGSVSVIAVQALVNMGGILQMIPLTGKPLPFISQGGSSLLASLALVGLVLSVSQGSRLEETEGDRRRKGLRVATSVARNAHDGGRGRFSGDESGMVGDAKPRSARASLPAQDRADTGRPRLRVIEGGATPLVRDLPSGPRSSTDVAGRTRIDLGPDARERLRGRDGRSTRNEGGTRRGR